MRPCLLCVVLLLVAGAACADGAFEVSVVQSTWQGTPFAGSVGSVRLCNVKAPEPLGRIDVFADGGLRLSESTENSIAGALVGASAGQRGSRLRFGAGYTYPGGFSVYTRAVVMTW